MSCASTGGRGERDTYSGEALEMLICSTATLDRFRMKPTIASILKEVDVGLVSADRKR